MFKITFRHLRHRKTITCYIISLSFFMFISVNCFEDVTLSAGCLCHSLFVLHVRIGYTFCMETKPNLVFVLKKLYNLIENHEKEWIKQGNLQKEKQKHGGFSTFLVHFSTFSTFSAYFTNPLFHIMHNVF